jgi:hypothetical protein
MRREASPESNTYARKEGMERKKTHRHNDSDGPKVLHDESESVPLRSFPEVGFIAGQDRPDILFFLLLFVAAAADVPLSFSIGFQPLLLDEVPFSSGSLGRRRSLGSRAQQGQGPSG